MMGKEKKLRVAIATTEVVPFSKVGGLADVIGSLSVELEKLGCEVSIFTPLYSSVDRKGYGLRRVKGLDLSVVVAGRKEKFSVFLTELPGSSVRVFFIENKGFYNRGGIYTEPESGEAFSDEDERTIFLNLSILETLIALGEEPDIIHCNDFHTGLIPAYINTHENFSDRFKETATVFSIHNLAYQGLFEPDFIRKANLDESLFVPMGPFEFYGKVNVMKAGIVFADKVSTVSETYAEEISTFEEYGYGLEGVLRSRRNDLVGILNGIDMDLWNPAKDELIPYNFNRDNLAGKSRNRVELLKEYSLPPKTKAPVIGMVSRLVDQKGFDILADAFGTLMKMNLKLVMLGTGQKKYHDLFSKLARKHFRKFGLKLEFNNPLAHLIEAGSDFFLMPSKYEPCGLNQMYSLRYGTIPIVRETGGLKDTIKMIDKTGRKGNGFTFREYSPEALIDAVRKAIDFYKDKDALKRVRKRIMEEDHSWRLSASKYIELYISAIKKKRMGLTSAQIGNYNL